VTTDEIIVYRGYTDTFDGQQTDVYPPNVRGLEIFGQGHDTVFKGKDCKFRWKKTAEEEGAGYQSAGGETQGAGEGVIKWVRDYLVKIYVDNVEVRSEYVQDTFYTYTYEKNVEDNGYARPTFTIAVWAVNRFNLMSKTPAVLTVSNAEPSTPVMPSLTPYFSKIVVSWEKVPDEDVIGYYVYADTFDPPTTRVAFVQADHFVFEAEPGTKYYIAIAAVDPFGPGGFRAGSKSSSASATTRSLQLKDYDLDLPLTKDIAWSTDGKAIWTSGTLTYKGTVYNIAGGSTTDKYIWWDKNDTPTTFHHSDTRPPIGSDVWLMAFYDQSNDEVYPAFQNKIMHAGLLQASSITADLIGANEIITQSANIKDGVIENAKIADAAITNAKIADATITAAKIHDLNADQITTGKLQSVDQKTYFDLDGKVIVVKDANGYVRVKVGLLNGDYGLEIRDAQNDVMISTGESMALSEKYVNKLRDYLVGTGYITPVAFEASSEYVVSNIINTSQNDTFDVWYPGPQRVAQKVTLHGDQLKEVRFYLRKWRLPTMYAYARIRRVSDDSIIETSSFTLDVSTLDSFNFTWVSFPFTCSPNEEVYVSFEYESATEACVEIGCQDTDVIQGSCYTYQDGVWTDRAPKDLTIQIIFQDPGYFPKEKTVDDATTTCWQPLPANETGAWITWKLSHEKGTQGCKIFWGPDAEYRPSDYRIYTSSDNSTWTERVHETAAPPANAWKEYSWSSVSCQYIRLVIGTHGSSGTRVYESKINVESI